MEDEVVGAGESGRARCHEEESGVGAFEEERHEGGGEEVCAGDIDVPCLRPHLTFGHCSVGLGIEPRTWDVKMYTSDRRDQKTYRRY